MLYLLKNIGGVKLLVVVNKNGGAGYPLPIELSPDGFTPTCIGDGEVDTVRAEVMPETAGGDVSERIGVIVGDHLGVTGGA